MKKWFCFMLVAAALLLSGYWPVYGATSEMEILLGKLVEKGILTFQEAEKILGETKETAAAQKEADKKELKALASKGEGLPDWIKNTKFKGDVRLRYQHEDTEEDRGNARNRGRFRLRLDASTTVADGWEAGFGIASGSDTDPRSTNQTMQDSFAKKSLWIDYAYAKYSPFKWLSLIGGRFSNPIWRPSDLLWDSDINPEGGAIMVNAPINDQFDFFTNAGFFIIDENQTGTDPLMAVFQPGFDWKITKNANLKVAGAYYAFSNVKGKVLDWTSYTNTGTGSKKVPGPGLTYDYNAPAFSTELAFNNLLPQAIPYLAFFGEYISNPDPSKENEGYIAGLKFGHKSVKKFGDWQFTYSYRHLERDAWLDMFPDSDFQGGSTGVKGHEAILDFGITKNVSFAIDYYRTEKIKDALNSKEDKNDLLQFDLNLKF
jgi:hypothetical protein